MDDLILKLFMADSGMDNPELAAAVLHKYGLAERYVPFAEKLAPLLRSDTDEAFGDGAAHVLDVFHRINFVLPPKAKGSEFEQGLITAMQAVDQVLHMAVDQAQNSTLAPEGAVAVDENPMDGLAKLFAEIFDEPTTR